jgi:hypothetical protein
MAEIQIVKMQKGGQAAQVSEQDEMAEVQSAKPKGKAKKGGAAAADPNATDIAKGMEAEEAKLEAEAKKEAEVAVDAGAHELMNDATQVEKDLLSSGPAKEAEEAAKEAMTDVDPCESLAKCLHVIMMNTIVFVVGLMTYLGGCYEQRKSELPETPVPKEDFKGGMEPVPLSACPGGFMSSLCCMAYFCQCCLRVELLGKMEKWDTEKTKTNMYIFVSVIMLGHVAIVTAAYALGFNKKVVHASGIVSLPIAWLGLVALGHKMAQWRMVMRTKKGDEPAGAPGNKSNELVVSMCCGPCAGGQEAEFIEKYEDTFGKQEW